MCTVLEKFIPNFNLFDAEIKFGSMKNLLVDDHTKCSFTINIVLKVKFLAIFIQI